MSTRWRSGCCAIIAPIWSPSAPVIRIGCAGTWSSSTPSWRPRCPRARWTASAGLTGSPVGWRRWRRPRGFSVARDELRRIRELTRAERALERELTAAIGALRPELLAEPGVGAITAATLIGRTAGAQRFPTDGHFARQAGAAPIPVVIRAARPRPTQPRRRPPTQRRTAPDRHHPRPHLPTDARLPRSQARRRQDPPRGLPLPQAPPRPPRLQAPATDAHRRHRHRSATVPRPRANASVMLHCNTPPGTPVLT